MTRSKRVFLLFHAIYQMGHVAQQNCLLSLLKYKFLAISSHNEGIYVLIFMSKKDFSPDVVRCPMCFQTLDLIQFHMWNVHTVHCAMCKASAC